MDNQSRWMPIAVCVIAGAIGAFLVYWGMMRVVTPDYYATITVPWLDRLLRSVEQYMWVPAVGGLLLVVSVLPGLNYVARRYTSVRILIGGIALLFIGFGGFLTFVSLSRFYALIAFSPLFLSGVLLGGVALGIHENLPRPRIEASNKHR